MKRNNNVKVISSLLLLLSISMQVMGYTYWVSPFGSDSNSGTSASSPFKTFYKASRALQSRDTLYVLPGLYSGSENSQITIDEACTIISTEGADQTIVVGPGLWQITESSVTISGIQFTNFNLPNSALFSVYNYDISIALTFTVNNITAYNNDLVIEIENANIFINLYNSNITNNNMVISHARAESSLLNGGVNMRNTTISNGSGGIVGFYDKVTITNNTFENIKCSYPGCAISLNKTTNSYLINQTLFTDCISSSNGGAIWLSSSTQGGLISSSIFLQNSALNGGAIYSLDSIEITQSKFISNYASSIGGAVYLKGSSSSISVGGTIDECEYSENSAATSAGAFYCENSVVSFQYCDFDSNYAPIGSSYQCGAGCRTYLYQTTSEGNSPSCPAPSSATPSPFIF